MYLIMNNITSELLLVAYYINGTAAAECYFLSKNDSENPLDPLNAC